MPIQKSGTYSEPGPISRFWCGDCDVAKTTFRERHYKGFMANGSEDRTDYLCPDCGSRLETEEIRTVKDLRPGDRVMVQQSHDHQWESRYLFRDDCGRPVIATNSERNCCHAEWPYLDASLTPILDGEDWTKGSQFAIGREIDFTLDQSTPQYPEGAQLRGTIISPHIKPNEWYVGFPTPEGWIFRRVVKESCFIVNERSRYEVLQDEDPV